MSKFQRNPNPHGREIRLGAIIGAAAGAALGLAYGALAKTADFSMGPAPTWLVAGVIGGLLGSAAGILAGLAGRNLLSRRAGLGFILVAALFALSRLADDTGQPVDKTLDIVLGGGFWGLVGAALAALSADAPPPAKDFENASAQRSGE